MNFTPHLVAGAALIAAGCALAVPASPPWAALLIGIALLLAAHILSLNDRERLIFRAFAGVPLVIALASAWFWAGVIAQCGVLLLILGRGDLGPEIRGPTQIAAVVCAVLVIGGIIDASNHMILPALVLIAGGACCAGILWVRQYRLKRTYRSTPP